MMHSPGDLFPVVPIYLIEPKIDDVWFCRTQQSLRFFNGFVAAASLWADVAVGFCSFTALGALGQGWAGGLDWFP